MFPIFSCSINVTVTSQNYVPSFHMNQTAYIHYLRRRDTQRIDLSAMGHHD